MKKTNKTFKRFAAITSASLLAACAMAPVFTSMTSYATTVKVTTTTDKATHTYTAYKIFEGTYNELGLTVTGWATKYDSAGLLADTTFTGIILEQAVEDDPDTTDIDESKAAVTVGSFIGSNTDAATVAQAIEKIAEADYDTLAEVLAKYTENVEGILIGSDGTDLGAGYYVIKDKYTVGENTNDALSKFILKVSGDNNEIVITPKKSYPTVEKKVQENQSENYAEEVATYEETDKSWNDVADYNIGDAVPFKLYGTLPSTLADYTNGYKYIFHDSIDERLTLIDADEDGKVDVIVSIDGNQITSGYTVANDADGNGFTVTFDNIKDIAGVTANSIVTVEYKAELNSEAIIGQNGQTNEVYLEYSNNPEWFDDNNETTVDNTTDKTPVDKVVVFTYELDVTKVDGATGANLAGAVFNLYRGSGENIEYVVVDGAGKVTGWTNDASAASKLTSDANGLFKIIGIDEGTYSLKEVTPPTGYNALTSDISLTITATTSNTQIEDADGTELSALQLTSGSITYNATDVDKYGVVKIDVANNKGTTLPGTGGIGTTIFYLGGGAMAAIGGIYLISKRRMKKSEE